MKTEKEIWKDKFKQRKKMLESILNNIAILVFALAIIITAVRAYNG